MFKPTTRLSLVFFAWLCVALALAWNACSRNEGSTAEPQASSAAAVKADTSRIHVMSIDELDQALARNQCTVLDANQQPVRIRNGTIPGATLLSHYQNYQLDELPQARDRTLVFYCANEMCRASDAAAEKALLAGHTHVNVLRAGIMGWAKAGKHTETVQ